ncbi:hypothetical protein SBADM41S_08144 [Streptomyces badius]
MRGTRRIPIDAFYTGVKRNALEPDELIRAVHVAKADGPQQFSKVGTRNAMVIAVCAFGLALHPGTRTVRTGIGSAAPTPVRATTAEEFLNAALDEGGFWENGKIITPSAVKRFADLCSAACDPIHDVRGTASYRRHAVGVMARRTLTWTWSRTAAPAAPRKEPRDARQLHRQRTSAGGRRRVGGRVPAVRAARADGPAGLQERLRAGRVRLLHGPPGRRAGVLLPGRGRTGRGPRGRHGRGPGGVRPATRRGRRHHRRPPRRERLAGRGPAVAGRGHRLPDRREHRTGADPAGVHRRRRRPVRLLHARAAGRRRRSAGAPPGPGRRGHPRGAVGQPVPLHRLRDDHGRRPPGRGPPVRGERT